MTPGQIRMLVHQGDSPKKRFASPQEAARFQRFLTAPLDELAKDI